MPPPNASPTATPANPTLAQIQTRVSGWGGGGGVPVRLVRPGGLDELSAALELARDGGTGRGLIARGMGRSYGDAAQLRDGIVLDTTEMKGIEFDPEHG